MDRDHYAAMATRILINEAHCQLASLTQPTPNEELAIALLGRLEALQRDGLYLDDDY